MVLFLFNAYEKVCSVTMNSILIDPNLTHRLTKRNSLTDRLTSCKQTNRNSHSDRPSSELHCTLQTTRCAACVLKQSFTLSHPAAQIHRWVGFVTTTVTPCAIVYVCLQLMYICIRLWREISIFSRNFRLLDLSRWAAHYLPSNCI